MIGDLKPYPAYRDSGVKWLGGLPIQWSLPRMKTIVHERCEKGFPNEPLLAATQTKGVVRKNQYENRTVLALKDLHLLKRVHTGDFVISLRSFQGGIEYAREVGIISPSYTVLAARDQRMHGFLACLFKSRPFVDHLSLYVTGIRQGQTVDYEALSRSQLPMPPLAEHAAIVRFLDHVDRRIRRYISAKKKLIALLNEQKQAIIHRAVTRGIDPKVRMKPSGVEWLGNVPEHWNVKPAKWYYREVNERSSTGAEELLSVSHITGVTPRSQKRITMFMAESYVGHKLCGAGDLVINTMWAWMAALGVSRQTGIVSPAYAVYRPTAFTAFLPQFIDYLLRTRGFVAEYVCRSTGIQSSRLRLYPEHFLCIPLICPPAAEQQRILDAVGSDTRELERGIQIALREIDLLREYRRRLIADVVTGKLDVREAAAHLPEEPVEREPIEETEPLAGGEEITDEPEEEPVSEEAEA